MNKGIGFAATGFATGVLFAGLPVLYGTASNFIRKPITDKDYLGFSEGKFVTDGGHIAELFGVNLNAPVFTYSEEGENVTKTDSEVFASLEERFGNYGVREIYSEAYEKFVTPADIKFLKKCGINCVRITLHSKLLTDNIKKKKINFDRTDAIVKACKKSGIYVIFALDYDDAKGLRKCGKAGFDNRNTFIRYWIQISKHYKDNPTIAAYIPLENDSVNDNADLITRTVRTLRDQDDRHIVIAGLSESNATEKEYERFIKLGIIPGYTGSSSAEDFAKSGFPAITETTADNCKEFTDNGVSVFVGDFKGTDKCLLTGEVPAIEIKNDSYDEIKDKNSKVLSSKNYKKDKKLVSSLKESSAGIATADYKNVSPEITWGKGKRYIAGV